MTEKLSRKVSATPSEQLFDGFISHIGGEIIHQLFTDENPRPKNADYFLNGRTVIAELKCLNEDYFNSPAIGKKAEVFLRKHFSDETITPDHVKNNVIDLPDEVAVDFIKIFMPSLKTAVEKANKQIKETKSFFSLPHAKGLIIFYNENNRSLIPALAFRLLKNLFKTQYSSIHSFIYLTKFLVYVPGHQVPRRLGVSGHTKGMQSGVDSLALKHVLDSWCSYIDLMEGTTSRRITCEDHTVIDKIEFI